MEHSSALVLSMGVLLALAVLWHSQAGDADTSLPWMRQTARLEDCKPGSLGYTEWRLEVAMKASADKARCPTEVSWPPVDLPTKPASGYAFLLYDTGTEAEECPDGKVKLHMIRTSGLCAYEGPCPEGRAASIEAAQVASIALPWLDMTPFVWPAKGCIERPSTKNTGTNFQRMGSVMVRPRGKGRCGARMSCATQDVEEASQVYKFIKQLGLEKFAQAIGERLDVSDMKSLSGIQFMDSGAIMRAVNGGGGTMSQPQAAMLKQACKDIVAAK